MVHHQSWLTETHTGARMGARALSHIAYLKWKVLTDIAPFVEPFRFSLIAIFKPKISTKPHTPATTPLPSCSVVYFKERKERQVGLEPSRPRPIHGPIALIGLGEAGRTREGTERLPWKNREQIAVVDVVVIFVGCKRGRSSRKK